MRMEWRQCPRRLNIPPWALVVVGVWALVRGAAEWAIRHSSEPVCLCPLKAATGCPCPTCGGTRALIALMQRDLPGAMAANALVVCAGFVVLAYVTMRLVFGRCPKFFLSRPEHHVAVAMGLVALVVQWAYLLVSGR